MESFFSFLGKRVDDCSSLLCVGLDPRAADLDSPTGSAARDFCLRIVKATASYAAAFKPNAAFFEALGPEGWTALKDVIEAIGEESQRLGSHIPVILDAKRGDIAATAEAYAHSAFEMLGADAITLNPYLGRDSIEPFIQNPERGVFLLCKTSNPGSADIQDLLVPDVPDGPGKLVSSFVPPSTMIPLHVHVARLADGWNVRDNIGLVVGATFPETLARVRAASPDLWILVPGVGAQGGDLESVLRAGLRNDGKGMLINVSRGISRAADPRTAAAELRDSMLESRASEIARRRRGVETRPAESRSADIAYPGAALADALLAAGCVRFGEFTLKSGLKSPIYIDLRRLITYPQLLERIGAAYQAVLKDLVFDRIAAVPYAAIPIATAISLQGNHPMIYPRKETKTYGTRADIEGEYRAGETAVLIDDLATTGGSKFEAIEKLNGAGLKVKDVVVLIDRQSGARESLADAGYNLHAVLTITQMLDHWENTGRVGRDQIEASRAFIAGSH
jgi:uridine monophosphate synthetase